MEQFFAASHSGEAGAAMMTSTASIQVNLDAGPQAGWADRVRLAHALGPTMIAIAANSPHAGRRVLRLAVQPAASVGPDGLGALRAHPGRQRRRPGHRLGALRAQGAGDAGAQPRRPLPVTALRAVRRLGRRPRAARRSPAHRRRPGVPPDHAVPAGAAAAVAGDPLPGQRARTTSGPRWCSRWSRCSTTRWPPTSRPKRSNRSPPPGTPPPGSGWVTGGSTRRPTGAWPSRPTQAPAGTQRRDAAAGPQRSSRAAVPATTSPTR